MFLDIATPLYPMLYIIKNIYSFISQRNNKLLMYQIYPTIHFTVCNTYIIKETFLENDIYPCIIKSTELLFMI